MSGGATTAERSSGDGEAVAAGVLLGLLGLGLYYALKRPKCPACGAKVENGAPYCTNCGVILSWPSR